MDESGLESYFDEDVADNFCILKRNIEIQIKNIKKILRFNNRTKKQTEDLKSLLQEYRLLKKRTKKIQLDFIDVFDLMDDFELLTEIFEVKVYHMDQIPILEAIEAFFEMDDTGCVTSSSFAYQLS